MYITGFSICNKFEAELKQLVERELRVYDQFDQKSKKIMKIVVDAVLDTAGKYSQNTDFFSVLKL
jgi:hypothetical protein